MNSSPLTHDTRLQATEGNDQASHAARIRALLVEDDPLQRNLLRSYAERSRQMELVDMVDDLEAARRHLLQGDVDLLLLDIGLPGVSGFTLLRGMPDLPPVVVITADAGHALTGYEHGVVDLLVKPFTFERFLRAINRVRRLKRPPAPYHPPVAALPEEDRNFILVRSERRMVRVPLDQLLLVRASGNQVRLNVDGKEILAIATMKELERMLEGKGFMRVHRTCIVAERTILEWGRNDLYTTVGEVPVGAAYRAPVRARFDSLLARGLIQGGRAGQD